mmetsp:Transcript_19826/g.24441  ORF Transcript_19826/g.24441 Transcript_19826/m.24441 type:complete len:230 (+) Transcript_19826:87-776(+)
MIPDDSGTTCFHISWTFLLYFRLIIIYNIHICIRQTELARQAQKTVGTTTQKQIMYPCLIISAISSISVTALSISAHSVVPTTVALFFHSRNNISSLSRSAISSAVARRSDFLMFRRVTIFSFNSRNRRHCAASSSLRVSERCLTPRARSRALALSSYSKCFSNREDFAISFARSIRAAAVYLRGVSSVSRTDRFEVSSVARVIVFSMLVAKLHFCIARLLSSDSLSSL